MHVMHSYIECHIKFQIKSTSLYTCSVHAYYACAQLYRVPHKVLNRAPARTHAVYMHIMLSIVTYCNIHHTTLDQLTDERIAVAKLGMLWPTL